MYAKIKDNSVVKYPFTIQNLKEENIYTIFPLDLDLLEIYQSTDTAVKEGSYLVEVMPSPLPDFDVSRQKIRESLPTFSNNQCHQTWVIEELADQEKQEIFDSKSKEVREKRNTLLKDSDWTLMIDSPLALEKKESYKIYRQQLRDLSNQLNFPWDVVWPVTP